MNLEPVPFLFNFTPRFEVAINRALAAVGAKQFEVEPDITRRVIRISWH